jgi:hypothetical protein|tara:strand:- start:284 stop:442 length:159 start_codon:yes stop_codon:yes gene_type:complete
MDKYKLSYEDVDPVVELLKDILGKLIDIETHLKKYEPKEDTKQLLTEEKTGE